MKQKQIADSLTIIGGDTLFFEDFDLSKIVGDVPKDGNAVLWYHDEDTLKTGILEVNEEGFVSSFLEKPHPDRYVGM